MITYAPGSIFDSPAQTLVNPVNCVGVMGGGLAAEFKRRWPEMFKAYRNKCNSAEMVVGEPIPYYFSDDRFIVNFPTKNHYALPSRIEWIDIGLEFFCVYACRVWGVTSVAFPALGCGLGGLDWKDVKPLMERHLSKLDIPVYIYPPKD